MKRTLAALVVATSTFALPLVSQSRVPLTRKIEYWNPAWSPDGQRILFESTLAGKMSVYVIGADGATLTRLTTDTSGSGQPTWSPDGRRIVFSSSRDGDAEIYVMNADGSAQAPLTRIPGTGGGYYQASFSPDGKWVVFQGRPDWALTRDRVYVIGADGTGLRLLSDTLFGAEGPRWTADGRVTFDQVPYPKRLWSELADGELDVAKAGTRRLVIRPDGTGIGPAPASGPVTRDPKIPADAEPSPDGSRFAYSKSVNGWMGLYVSDATGRIERLITGGPGAGPVGYLRTATLAAVTDTLDSWTGPRGGKPAQKDTNYVVRTLRKVGAQRWELADTWYDGSGRVTARQSTRTRDGSLVTEIESVRALVDSATLLVNGTHVTAWVVPQGQPARMFDGNITEERYAGAIVNTAIARSHPSVGTVFYFPSSNLYGPNPLDAQVDSVRVVQRGTLRRGATAIPVVVLERGNGSQYWLDDATGAEVLSRGNAGPERWWWHIRRGVSPPD